MKMGTTRSLWRYDCPTGDRPGHPSIRCPFQDRYADPLAPNRPRSQSAAMTKRLPRGDQAIVDLRKIEDYCLSSSHPRGRHKARVFREALDLQRNDAAWLRDVLLEAARSNEASPIAANLWGAHWRLDAVIGRQGKSAMVRTIWCEPARACRDLSPVGCCDENEKGRKERKTVPSRRGGNTARPSGAAAF